MMALSMASFLLGLVLEDQLALRKNAPDETTICPLVRPARMAWRSPISRPSLTGRSGEGPARPCRRGRRRPSGPRSRPPRRWGRSGACSVVGAVEHDPDEHAQLEQAVGVGGLGQERHGPGGRGRPAPRPRAAWPRRSGRGRPWRSGGSRLPRLGSTAEVRLGDVGDDPDGRQVGQGEEHVVHLGLLAGDGRLADDRAVERGDDR